MGIDITMILIARYHMHMYICVYIIIADSAPVKS